MNTAKFQTLEINPIPFGPLTLENYIGSAKGKEVIRQLKTIGADPEALVLPFLASYQVMDIMMQLYKKGRTKNCSPEEQEKIYEFSSRYVVENFTPIVQEIGQKRMAKVLKALSPKNSPKV